MKKIKPLIVTIVCSLIVGINFGGVFVYLMYKSDYAELMEKHNNHLMEHKSFEYKNNIIKEDPVKLVKTEGETNFQQYFKLF